MGERVNADQTAKRVLVGLDILIAGLSAYLILRIAFAGKPVVRMRLANLSENFCEKQARGWANLADKARTSYERARDVTV